MVRGGAKKEENAEMEERKRLKKLAFRNNLLSETPSVAGASGGSHALSPSKTVMKHHGKDIIRKSQRSGKNRYLFSFPGLLAPVSGGRIGELKDLGTKNPILYLDFPQGQMKLFGTIVYPKNKYLTLQFSRTGKNVICEDYFENMIVFSDAWWIGKKDENPEEACLEFPKELNAEHEEYDFKGGAGSTCDRKPIVRKPGAKHEELSPERDMEDDSSDSHNNSKGFAEVTPTRHSARMAGKTFKLAEASSADDFVENEAEISEGEGEEEKVDIEHAPKNYTSKKTYSSCHTILNIDKVDAEPCTSSVPKKGKQTAKSVSKAKELAHGNQAPLVQPTISTLFKKAGEKRVHIDLNEKMGNVKVSGPRRKRNVTGRTKTGMESKVREKEARAQVEDDIEEFTSTSQDITSSDDDWIA